MRISKAQIDDLQAIKKLWIESFPLEKQDATDFYFENLFHIEDTYVMKLNDELVCMLQTRPMHIMLQQPLKASFIVGVATLKQHQHKGYMSKLLNKVLSELEKDEPFTLLQAYDWNLYKPFGFEVAYYLKKVIVQKEIYENEQIEDINVCDNASGNELSKLYEQYTKDKQGYRIRDEAYYDAYLKPYSNCNNEKWIFIFSQNKELIGYAIYENTDQIIVSEFIVKNQNAKNMLIKILLSMNKELVMYCCEDEHIYGTEVIVPAMMMRKNKKIRLEKSLYINEYL